MIPASGEHDRNPTNNPANAEAELRQAEAAANTLGLQTIHILQASTEPDLNGVFSTLIQQRAGGLVITADIVFRIMALTRGHD